MKKYFLICGGVLALFLLLILIGNISYAEYLKVRAERADSQTSSEELQ